MKFKQLSLAALCAAFVLTLSFVACKKDSNSQKEDNTSDIEIAENNVLAEGTYNDMTIMTDQAINTGAVALRVDGANGTEGTLGGPCATVAIDTVANPHTITIDFGTANCLCADGRNRRGKIIASYTGRYRDSNAVITFTVNNYFVNDNQIKGTKTITNKGHNAAGHLVYKVEVNGQIVKANNAGTVNWVSTQEREWTAGEYTLTPLDDIYSITGTASGTTAAGGAYTIAITKPLVRQLVCRWFESGVISLTPQGKPARTLDYGSSGCDANATVTIAGISFPVVLP